MTTAPPNKRTRRRRKAKTLWLLIDRYLVVVSAGLVAGVWLLSDVTGLNLSQGTQAALGAFVGYSLVKQKADSRWRALELEQSQLVDLISALEKTKPGSDEAIAVRRELVALAREAQTAITEDET